MKKHLIFALIFAACLSSCKVKEEAPAAAEQASGTPTVFHATIENSDSSDPTKVYTDEALHVLWNANDNISIFAKKTLNKKYRFKGADGATGGTFEEVASGEFGSYSDIDFNYGIYPYLENTGYLFDDIIQVDFPKIQNYQANTFGREANLMVAKSSTTDLNFKNVGGYLCFKLYGNGFSVRSILLKGNNGETLSGPIKISFDTENIPTMVFDDSDPSKLNKEIVLKADTPVALGASEAEAVTFWMVIPPVHFTGGFTITVIDSAGGIHEKTTTKDVAYTRNKRVTMAAFEIKNEALAPLEQGIYPFIGTGYVFNKVTDQVNIYESEGNAWVRFLEIPTLTMREMGPIPLSASAGDVLDVTLTTYVNGVVSGTPENSRITVQSVIAGKMNAVSDEGARYVFRF